MLETTVQHNEKRRDALQRDIDAFLSEGKMIEVLGTPEQQRKTPHHPGYFNTRDK